MPIAARRAGEPYAYDRQVLLRSREWIQKNGDAYRGQWIVVYNGELLGSACSLAELDAVVADAPEGTYITRWPERGEE